MIKAKEETVFERINSEQLDIYGNAYAGLEPEINRLIELLEKYAPQIEQKDIEVCKTCIGQLKTKMDGVLAMTSGIWSREDIENSFSRLAYEEFGVETEFDDLYKAAIQQGILREHQILESLVDEDSFEEENWSIYLHGRLDQEVLAVLQEMKAAGMLPESPATNTGFDLS